MAVVILVQGIASQHQLRVVMVVAMVVKEMVSQNQLWLVMLVILVVKGIARPLAMAGPVHRGV